MVRELFSRYNGQPNGAPHEIVLFGHPILINTDDGLGEGGNVWTAVQVEPILITFFVLVSKK